MIRRALPGLAVAALVALGGCVTLFPKETPVPLYRFGDTVQATPASGPSFAVRNAGLSFDQAASGDAIVTVTGDQVAYVSGGRWAAPAPMMFSAAVQRGFEASGGQVRLIQPGEAGQARYVMRLAVTHFEARYDNGPTAAPTVVVTLHASLTKSSDQGFAGAQEFRASVPASDNRVGAIAEAFDQATSQVVGQAVGWVEQTGAGGS